jgi:DNA-binding GntR family transcriptional regulator
MRWLLRQHEDPAAMHAEHVALLDAVLAGDRPTVERLAAQHVATSRAAAARRLGGSGSSAAGEPDADAERPAGR